MISQSTLCVFAGAVLLGTTPVQWVQAQRAPAKPTTSAHARSVPVVKLTPGSDALNVLLAREADSAAKYGQLALVDLGTKGCEVCHVFHNTLTDPVMIAALTGARLIELDGDDWSSQAITDGFQFDGDLPILFVVTPQGREGSIFNHTDWADARAKLGPTATDGQVMGPPLQTFLMRARDSTAHAHARDSTAHANRGSF